MLDVIVLIMIISFAIVGYRRGLIRTVITLCSSIIALIVAFIGYPIVSAVLKVTPIYTSIYTGVFNKIESIDFGKGIQTQGNAILNQITWLPEFLTEQIKNNNNTAMYDLLGAQNIQEYISAYVTQMIIALIAILLTWVIIKIILVGVLGVVGGIVEHLPIISSLNRIGGFGLGLIKGLLTLSIIGLIIPFCITVPLFNELSLMIEASSMTKWLYENNLILLIYYYLIQQ